MKSALFAVLTIHAVTGLREFRSWSNRTLCPKSQWPNYPFAFSKYHGQTVESKSRVNTNLQDIRHTCQTRGGRSKCHICEDIVCSSDKDKTCHLQLQGVNSSDMSINIPAVSDTAWPVEGHHLHDYGGSNVSHFCTFITGGSCIQPNSTNFENCVTRCFGYGFSRPARYIDVIPRSVVDLYPGLGKWSDDGQVDYWAYPRNCSELLLFGNQSCVHTNASFVNVPDFNPQGFSFTVVGNGTAGMQDGMNATFFSPEDVAVDDMGNIYVADTLNNAIRFVTPKGNVSTIAGQGPGAPGYRDGSCNEATFTEPKGLDVRMEESDFDPSILKAVIVIADTGNHRIRQIDYINWDGVYNCTVKCLAGLCGNNTLSATLYKFKASPFSGYADGNGLEARFSAPQGVAFMDGNNIAVADTGNFLIRWVTADGNTTTLAGTIIDGEKDPQGNPLPGCPPPCLQGQQGFRDGHLMEAQFYNPAGVTRGPNNTVWVADEQRIRIVEVPEITSTLYGIESMARVSTVAGIALQGHEDGVGDESSFFDPSGLFATDDNIVHVVDSASCRIRRITPMPLVAQSLSCSDRAVDIIRPSGCTSYDHAIDKIGRKVSRVEANIQYNYGWPFSHDVDRGKYIKNCVGVPPLDTLEKRFVLLTGDNLVVDDNRTVVNEDSEQGMAIMVFCPANCLGEVDLVEGSVWYSEFSSICRSAIHAGVLDDAGGYVEITMERRDYLWLPGTRTDSSYASGSIMNNIKSKKISSDAHRVFNVRLLNQSQWVVHTVGGHPSALLEDGCGFADAQPSTFSYFNKPRGIAARKGISLSDTTFIYIADSANNRIRALSAVCTQICENGGRCIAHDTCECRDGWFGLDCTQPLCSLPLPPNTVCVAPNKVNCKPGFGPMPNCEVPQCVQECYNGARCSAPNTCSCKAGWFDSNCTTPVCSQTCANGGNCTAPNTCACPSQWQGEDCRIPVCKQTCLNGGFCIAPDTCSCPPQWSNYDCGVPVCTQGYFVPNPSHHYLATGDILSWPTYKNCDMISWCNITAEFECDQLLMSYGIIQVPSGPKYRNVTGRAVPPVQCMEVELPISYKIPFNLLEASGSTTGYRRFSPISPYESDPKNPWRGYFSPTIEHTGPWKYNADRQIAYVNWLLVSQGVYVCANGGNCTSPGICECAPGWIGFDCRTPVCDQGYYFSEQDNYVSGLGGYNEVEIFEPFMTKIPNSTDGGKFLQHWPYSNPSYGFEYENLTKLNLGEVIRTQVVRPGERYLGPADWSSNFHNETLQGGYRCSVRAFTRYENVSYILAHPNYYSRYMNKATQADDKVYTEWMNMSWPPVHKKSRVLDQYVLKSTFAYTNEGYRRFGIWSRTDNFWEYGVCLIQFRRNCSTPTKAYNLETQQYTVDVQDTDIAYRPRILYNDQHVYGSVGRDGRWREAGGACVDQVLRGCKNNGTCVAPNKCECASGWSGYDCTVPVCAQVCHHHGNCTGPNQCTCERGWSGFDCLVPICAQECQNRGKCVAPDVCQCLQWPSTFRDNRIAGGQPLFRDQYGNSLATGWTGYDCSTPICVQAETFHMNFIYSGQSGLKPPEQNIPIHKVGPTQTDVSTLSGDVIPGYFRLGGNPHEGVQHPNLQMTPSAATDLKAFAKLYGCLTSEGNLAPRCPILDYFTSGNLGTSFQTGCGYDPFDTGCCVFSSDGLYITCYYCNKEDKVYDEGNHTFYCNGEMQELTETVDKASSDNMFDMFREAYFPQNYHLCGQYHSPRAHNIISIDPTTGLPYSIAAAELKQDYGIAFYYKNLDPLKDSAIYSSKNFMSNLTSSRFLCHIFEWIQGDYIDDAGLGNAQGVGSIYGLGTGRSVRTNFPNIQQNALGDVANLLTQEPGEGVYACYNSGSCNGPDHCTCTDGYSGYDCQTPLCRHLQPSTNITGCLNGGICVSKDNCACTKTGSVLWQVHPGATRGLTGWTGTDCSMPVCVQGYFDPFCTDLPNAPGGEGCYRCANGGNCTAPDVCQCARGWTGFDCKTPVCETVADPLTRLQLPTVFEHKVISFESDPCAAIAIYGIHGFRGQKYARGNCSQPNQCTCFCKTAYNLKACKKFGQLCDGPWQDEMIKVRNVLKSRGPEYEFGSTGCVHGYEGNVDDMNRFTTCHQTIYIPSNLERSSLNLTISMSVIGFIASVVFYFVRKRLQRRYLLAKIERRRSKRSSEESLLQAGAGAFVNR